MKKNIFVSLAIISIFSISGIAFAASGSFSDQGSFADWFRPSVEKLSFNNIISGYPDGSFKPTNGVNRAELSVILDRFASALGKDLPREATICTLEARSGVQIMLQDNEGNALKGATIAYTTHTAPTEEIAFDEGNDGTYSGIFEGNGHYKFTIKKAGYTDHVETVNLEKDACHVMTEFRTITLIKK